jgi:hypothetical protein
VSFDFVCEVQKFVCDIGYILAFIAGSDVIPILLLGFPGAIGIDKFAYDFLPRGGNVQELAGYSGFDKK